MESGDDPDLPSVPKDFPVVCVNSYNTNLGDVDIDTLIAEVYSRSGLWDRRLPMPSNLHYAAQAWREISNSMGFPDHILRRKWKNLRNQYGVELAKPTTKWAHFEKLSFMKGFVKPRGKMSAILSQSGRHPLGFEQSGNDPLSSKELLIKQRGKVDDSLLQPPEDPLALDPLENDDSCDEDPLRINPSLDGRAPVKQEREDDSLPGAESFLPSVSSIKHESHFNPLKRKHCLEATDDKLTKREMNSISFSPNHTFQPETLIFPETNSLHKDLIGTDGDTSQLNLSLKFEEDSCQTVESNMSSDESCSQGENINTLDPDLNLQLRPRKNCKSLTSKKKGKTVASRNHADSTSSQHKTPDEESSDTTLEDQHFLESILPHVQKIPPHLKLRFRNRMLALVEEFAYPNQTDGQY